MLISLRQESFRTYVYDTTILETLINTAFSFLNADRSKA